ncbi:MAG: hypothetical protein AAF065_02085 [Verrucomicrobiota bacterium]
MARYLAIAAFALSACPFACAIVIDLDFSGGSVNYSNPNQTLVIIYSDIANGVGAPNLDLRLEALTTYIPNSAAAANNQNGSVSNSDDLKLHLDSGQSTRFRFSIFNGGTETLYDPGVDYSYDFVMYDIDGNTSNPRGADSVTFYTPLTYTVTDTTSIDVMQSGNAITFTGTAGSVAGNEGLSSFANQDQEDASVSIVISNTSQFEFDFATPQDVPADEGGRNLLIDPGSLAVDGDPVVFVPEMSFTSAILGIFAAFVASRRRAIG